MTTFNVIRHILEEQYQLFELQSAAVTLNIIQPFNLQYKHQVESQNMIILTNASQIYLCISTKSRFLKLSHHKR